MIKKIVLMAAMGAMGLLWGSGDVTVQVINAVKEASITQEFDKKLAKSGLEIHKVVEGGRYIVTLGTFKDEKSAQAALKKARLVVCKEAFIRPVKRDQTAVASHETVKDAKAPLAHAVAASPVNEAKVAAVATSHESPKVQEPEVPTQAKEAVVAVSAKNEHIVVVEVKPVSVEVKNEPSTAVLSNFEKKEMHKSEIADAINFYKNSPYHRFEPVMLQR